MTVRVDLLRIREKVRRAALAELIPLAFSIVRDFRSASPVNTGRLRDSWGISNISARGFTIRNSAPYAQEVDEGSSRRAPAGIVDPVLARYGLRRR